MPKRDDDPVLCHFSNVDYVDTWKVLEDVARKGLTKSIGVSNFSKRQLERILEVATIKPVNNQVSLFSLSVASEATWVVHIPALTHVHIAYLITSFC